MWLDLSKTPALVTNHIIKQATTSEPEGALDKCSHLLHAGQCLMAMNATVFNTVEAIGNSARCNHITDSGADDTLASEEQFPGAYCQNDPIGQRKRGRLVRVRDRAPQPEHDLLIDLTAGFHTFMVKLNCRLEFHAMSEHAPTMEQGRQREPR